MNKIEKLIQELCPEGVPTVRLGDQASYVRGLTYSKSDELDGGPVRVLRSNNIDFERNVLNFESVKTLGSAAKAKSEQLLRRNDILISAASGSRAHVGKVAYIHEDIDFYFGGFMAVLRAGPDLESRYLFHVLTSSRFRDYLDQAVDSTTINNLNAQIMGSFPLPLPPIQVQQEIVSILDKFTKLEAELEAELEGRTSLFEALRTKLFEEASTVSKAELGSLCDMYSGEFVKKDRQGNNFVYPVYNGGSEPTGFYSEFNSPENTIVIASRGSIGSVSFVKTPFWAGNSCFVLRNPIIEVNYRYLYHYLKHSESELYKLRAVGTIPALNLRPLLKFEVPIPDLNHQERISSILDKFEQLESDIQFGLPAEIQARRKQYEYYRNNLLTFKEFDAA